jgi:2-dehydro-3-deoxyphosphogluconate aldolase/(4S)-4-hydroxy-2-oxoglutarate aldolase
VAGCRTVSTVDDVTRAANAGASFVVRPALGPSVAESRRRRLPVIVGVFTPSEVVPAVEGGADAIKLFPTSLGGPDYVRALRGPFPSLPFVPVGGIDEDASQRYLEAGAIAVGVGSPLVADAASGGSLDDLRVRARAFRRAAVTAALS